jgi:hypothetical protein
MLVKSSKSRFAAMALMALGVSTFMGTSAALASTGVGVNVTGTVGCTATSSTVSASAVAFGAVAKGATNVQSLYPTVTQGKNTDCSDKNSSVKASIYTFSGEALPERGDDKVLVDISPVPIDSGAFPMSAFVPLSAANGPFGATVTLTLED